ncbi:MAG: alpha-glucosidase/alpha-galactosidase, partial [Candidatus Latescibacteria bacterium]|nr:alpha-glucosidase/alpha-galactosidase [Candidatus Latescibacterota bacterium]
MAKIAHIGAGSAGFGKSFLADCLTRPSLQDATLCLMDINPDHLEMMLTAAKRIKEQLESPVEIEATADRRRALDGADYVIITIVSDGFEPRKHEHHIPKKYGVYPTSGCTSGPSGIFRGLRYIPVILDLARELEELSPDALMLDYSNPSSIVPWAVNQGSSTSYLGLCHSVPNTALEMARIAGIPYEETGHWAAGINHQAWMLRFEWKGKDAYPLIWEKMEDPEVYQKNIVKFELLKHFGCWVTESSVHNAEYVAWFRKTAETCARYTPDYPSDFDWVLDHEEKAGKGRENLREEIYRGGPLDIGQSHEYCIGIIDAIESNVPARINGNVPNTGLITNLPQGACVEVPILVDNMGLHPCYVGDLP